LGNYDFLLVSLTVVATIFPDGSGLAGTRMSLSWILLKLRMIEVMVTIGAIRSANLQSNRHQ